MALSDKAGVRMEPDHRTAVRRLMDAWLVRLTLAVFLTLPTIMNARAKETQTMPVPEEKMTQIIAQGTQGTALAPWDGILNFEDVRQVILFIRRTIQQQQ